MSEEVWKDIEGYEGLYQVSNLGNVRSFQKSPRGKLLRFNIDTDGYCLVGLSRKDIKSRKAKVHRLVIEAFVGKIPDGMHVNHLNGVKSDNRIDNLEIVTPYQNVHHAMNTGLFDINGEKQVNAKLTDEQVLEIRARYIPRVYSQHRLAREYGVCVQQINRIIHRKRWKHI